MKREEGRGWKERVDKTGSKRAAFFSLRVFFHCVKPVGGGGWLFVCWGKAEWGLIRHRERAPKNDGLLCLFLHTAKKRFFPGASAPHQFPPFEAEHAGECKTGREAPRSPCGGGEGRANSTPRIF